MWRTLLNDILHRLIKVGALELIWPNGDRSHYGPGGALCATIEITDPDVIRRLCLFPVLALGEGYVDGKLRIAEDRLFDTLTLLARNSHLGELPAFQRGYNRLRGGMRGWLQRNTSLTARRNVSHHYDISDAFYRLFLDEDMQYSCAYFASPDMSLDQAQAAKKALIAAKLRLEPGMRVLDIGCGWGGMALTLAREHGVHVTGVTLSSNQHAAARSRARAAGLDRQTDFRLCDYRNLNESFDRIVSVGMLEHVGVPQYPVYFGQVRRLLAEDGVALVHTIGRSAPPSPTSPWLEKYIFPGGYVPSLSDLAAPMENAGLWLADLEVWRGHYGPTLHHWRARFESRVDQVREMYDERFVRMWRFYLVACEMAFEEQHQAVFQLQLSRQQHVVPNTRDYLYAPDAERMMHAAQ